VNSWSMVEPEPLNDSLSLVRRWSPPCSWSILWLLERLYWGPPPVDRLDREPLFPLGTGNWMPARFLNCGVPAPECRDRGPSWRLVLLEWRWEEECSCEEEGRCEEEEGGCEVAEGRCEEEGGRERGGPKGSGRPFTFMLLGTFMLVCCPPWSLVPCLYCPLVLESYREWRRSGSLAPLGVRAGGGGAGVGGAIPTGGRLVELPPSYPLNVDSLRPLAGTAEEGGCELGPEACSTPLQLL